MPPIGLALGNVDFSELEFVLQDATLNPDTNVEIIGKVSIRYGKFIQSILDFIIISFVIFMMLRIYTKMQKRKEETVPDTPASPSSEQLLTEIRDILKNT